VPLSSDIFDTFSNPVVSCSQVKLILPCSSVLGKLQLLLMSNHKLPLNQILHGSCIDILPDLPENSLDLIFADPPYNLQLQKALWRPNMTRVDAVNDDWDQFSSFAEYDTFSLQWLQACRRVLKANGSLWVIGAYHNIYRIGKIMQDLGFWFLNDVIWVKTNPMPNFRGVRFTNAHETLLWASKNKNSKYTFNHQAMKAFNEDKQMRSDWLLPTCVGPERIKINGKKAHSTQKPEALLYRVILAASSPGDVVLDPFFGSGTTGAVAKTLHRHYIGVEKDERYVQIARERLDAITPEKYEPRVFDVSDTRRRRPRLAFIQLLEHGLLKPGQKLFFRADRTIHATIKPNGKLLLEDFEGSIHQAGRYLMGDKPCNGWDQWYFDNPDGKLIPIDDLRITLIQNLADAI
jgi:site-specific DNA-methyltransferase (adenine-specific)